MSEPKRYLAKISWTQIETEEHPAGEFVRWSDYARLKAEVELLRYVGDGLAVMVGHIEVTGDAHRMMLELSKEWEAAKEGKQS